ncbi:50S ribosomal protein L21, mitochondrial [Andrographis paniculata]|uniref:50S ribosomal protein L21, mitochondrial n=1 Tax=Andrographis paniculata TaxID=175694 RepID=UPI0021E7D881|nr:50S ribosomal protein L21, mitochondrial [Andrographis paniculata]
MANRRCVHTLTRILQSVRTIAPLSQGLNPAFAQGQISASRQRFCVLRNNADVYPQCGVFSRHFCSRHSDSENDDDGEDEESEGEEIDGQDEDVVLSPEDKVKEAAEIGYRVVGLLQESDRVVKPYEPVFAVVQIGSHQFKVSNGDSIFVERLKHCDINDKLVLNKVLMLGSQTQTMIGRPILPDAAVHAIVEEHALDAKVIIFKKKRRKNYRRKKGHRQELTKLRITDIEGIEKPKRTTVSKTTKKDKPDKKMAVES